MTHKPTVARTLQKLRRSIADFRAAGESIALVPTMGALHAGHLALMSRARRQADRVIVSIFVNPTQFAPQEDLSRYPRDFERDLAALTRERIDSVWAPSVAVMYPQGFATRIVPQGPASAGLEDAFRPHFFAGVATVVAKLLMQCRPDVAVFGEKDYQQLRVVTRIAQDLDIPTKIVGVPTVREKDGLALSSRNAYLSAAERRVAPVLHRVLADCAGQIAKGKSIPAVIADGRAAIEAAGFALDYLEARHARTLAPMASKKDGPIRVLAAARLGTTRLIDNVAV